MTIVSSEDLEFGRLRAAVAETDTRVPRVSAWSVGMHVHHCCLSMVGVARALEASKPPPPPHRRSLLASILLRVGRIPRGRAQARESLVPGTDVSQGELFDLLETCEGLLVEVGRLHPQTWFEHFVFGVLDRDGAVRFLRIHNRHHLRIIADIVAAHR